MFDNELSRRASYENLIQHTNRIVDRLISPMTRQENEPQWQLFQ
jgi:hypothetical protein